MKDLHDVYQSSLDTWARLCTLTDFYVYDDLLNGAIA